MRCEQCGAENPDGYERCADCGAAPTRDETPRTGKTVTRQVFSSPDEMPPEIREKFEQMRVAGRTSGSHTTVSVTDKSGRQQTYDSLDEMPSELRQQFGQAFRGGTPPSGEVRTRRTAPGPEVLIGSRTFERLKWVTAVLFGLLVPGVIAWFAITGIIERETLMPGDEELVEVTGAPAIGLGIAYLGLALGIHGWGCWSIFPVLKPHRKRVRAVAAAIGVGGGVLALILWMAG